MQEDKLEVGCEVLTSDGTIHSIVSVEFGEAWAEWKNDVRPYWEIEWPYTVGIVGSPEVVAVTWPLRSPVSRIK
jgi:hypothetical protein